jgi:hypothetical protein
VNALPGPQAAWPFRCCTLFVVCAALATGAAGCSGGGKERDAPADPLQGALSHLRSDSGAVFVVATDSKRGPVAGLDRLGSAYKGWRSLKRQIESSVGLAGIDFDRLRPQLGNPFALAITREGKRVGAIRVQDPAALRKEAERRIREGKAERLDETDGALAWREKGLRPQALAYSAVVGDDFVVAQTEQDLKDAIDAAHGTDNLLSERVLRTKLGRMDPRALVRLAGDAQRLLASGDAGQAADAGQIPWVRALGTFAGTFEVHRSGVTLDLRVRTDRARLGVGQLPLEPGTAAPLLHDPQAPGAVAIRRPEQFFRFLEKLLEATDPGTFARLQAGVEQMRAIFGVDVNSDLLQKIDNLSIAVTSRRTVTLEGRLKPGSEAAFTRSLDRAEPFIEGVAGDLLSATGTVEARGAGAQRVWLIRNRGRTIARYAVRDGTLVGTIGPGDLPVPVRGRRVPGASGSLVIRGNPAPVAPLVKLLPGVPKELVDIIPSLPNVTVGVRAEPDELIVRARVPVIRR